MRRFRGHERGLAEIVGTLMLVLIVVVAVTAFAAFVASYQAQLQKEQAAAHQRSLEDIRILSVSTVAVGGNYSSLTFVAGSLDINTMEVNELLVNGQFINYYSVTPLNSATTLLVCPLCNPMQYPGTVEEFNLTSLEQVTVTVSLTLQSTSNPTGGFLEPYTLATSGPTDYVSISLYTILGNDFSRTFAAPNAVALIEQSEIFSGTNYTPVFVFDGSESIVPTNDSIVSWSWSIDEGAATCSELSGEKALVPESDLPYGTYSVMLTILDSNGLAGTATIPLTSVWNTTTPAIDVCSSQGPVGGTETLTGTGFLALENVTATFGGTSLSFSGCSSGTPTTGGLKITTTASGRFVCTFTVPTSTTGSQTIVVTNTTSPAKPTTTFTVLPPTIKVNPAEGPQGATVTVSGSGFSLSTLLTALTFDGVLITACTFGSLMANATGAFGCTFAVPPLTSGTTVMATDFSGQTATGAFIVTMASITVSPVTGSVGSMVTVSGTGFSVSTTLTSLVFDSVPISSFVSGSLSTDGSGAFRCTFVVPSGTSGSTVVATDIGGQTATATFTVT